MPSDSVHKKQAIVGVVFDETRTQVLLIKRRDIPVWVLPGGGLDAGENPDDGVCREVLEETGYRVKILRKVAEYLPVNWMTQLTHLYECQIVSGASTLSSESQAIHFFPLRALPLLPPPYEGWIRDAEANHPHMIQKKIEGVTVWILIKLLIQHPLLVGRYLLTKLGIHLND